MSEIEIDRVPIIINVEADSERRFPVIMHGDDDQIVPIGASALLSSKIVKGSTLKIYSGAPHGLCSTHKDRVNADLLDFLGSGN